MLHSEKVQQAKKTSPFLSSLKERRTDFRILNRIRIRLSRTSVVPRSKQELRYFESLFPVKSPIVFTCHRERRRAKRTAERSLTFLF